jgi:hypothetical protein
MMTKYSGPINTDIKVLKKSFKKPSAWRLLGSRFGKNFVCFHGVLSQSRDGKYPIGFRVRRESTKSTKN